MRLRSCHYDLDHLVPVTFWRRFAATTVAVIFDRSFNAIVEGIGRVLGSLWPEFGTIAYRIFQLCNSRVAMLNPQLPIQMPKRARGQRQMKGRPITREEFERMLKAAEVVRPKDFAIWKELLEGLWLSGLRLGDRPGADSPMGGTVARR